MTAAVMSTPSSEARSRRPRRPGMPAESCRRCGRRWCSAVVFLGAWELAVEVFDWKPYFLTPPSAIWQAFVDNFSFIWDAAVVSGTNALVGLVLGVLLGVAMSFLLMRFNVLNDMIGPLAVALNAIPIVVLVAVFNEPVLQHLRGAAAADGDAHRLLRRARERGEGSTRCAVDPPRADAVVRRITVRVLRNVRVPNAVPYLFTALKIAAPLAVITAIVSEYFGGPQNGLGYAHHIELQQLQERVGWAYVLGACFLGLAFYLISIALENITNHYRGASPRGENT